MPEGRHARRDRRDRWTAGLIAVVAFMTTIDNTIVNVALPSIGQDLRMSLSELQWVVTGYLVTFSALMLAGGRLADRYGTRRVLLLGLAVFTAASLLAGTAGDAAVLLTARMIQGAGSALVLPAALAIVATGGTERERETGAAVWMSSLAAALAAGPVVGGWLSQHLHWNWIFLVNLPIGVAGLIIGWVVLEESQHVESQHTSRPEVLGLLCSTVALAAGTFILIEGPSVGWLSPSVTGTAVLMSMAVNCFGFAERRAAVPMIDPALLRERAFAGGVAASVLWGAGVNGVFFFTSLFLQQVAHFSATRTGLVFLPLAVVVVLVAPRTAGLVKRFGAARTVAAGLVLVAAGLVAVSLVRSHVTMVRLLPGVILIGAGTALTSSLTSSVLAAVPSARTGVAGSLLNVAREASGLLGIALVGVIVTGGRPVSAYGSLTGTLAHGYETGLLMAAGMVVVGAVVATLTLPGPPPRPVAQRRKMPPAEPVDAATELAELMALVDAATELVDAATMPSSSPTSWPGWFGSSWVP